MIQRASGYNAQIRKTLEDLCEVFTDMPFTAETDIKDDQLSWEVQGVGEYVFNKQRPLKQLWVSSPLSGPARFELQGESWINLRSRKPLHRFMQDEIAEIRKKIELQAHRR